MSEVSPTTDNNKIGDFPLKEKMNIGEVKKAKTFAKDMIGFQAKIAKATNEELEKMAESSLERSDSQDAYLFAVFQRCLGMTEEQFNALTYDKAGVMFDKLIGASVASKKSNPLSG